MKTNLFKVTSIMVLTIVFFLGAHALLRQLFMGSDDALVLLTGLIMPTVVITALIAIASITTSGIQLARIARALIPPDETTGSKATSAAVYAVSVMAAAGAVGLAADVVKGYMTSFVIDILVLVLGGTSIAYVMGIDKTNLKFYLIFILLFLCFIAGGCYLVFIKNFWGAIVTIGTMVLAWMVSVLHYSAQVKNEIDLLHRKHVPMQGDDGRNYLLPIPPSVRIAGGIFLIG